MNKLLNFNMPSISKGGMLGMLSGSGSGSGFDMSELKSYNKCDVASSPDTNVAATVGSSDSLGTASDMAVTGGTFQQSGVIQYSISFDGTDDKSNFGSSVSQFNFIYSTSYEFSLNFWYAKLSANPNVQTVFMNQRASGATAGIQWKFDDRNTARKFEISIKQGNTAFINKVTTMSIPADTDFHMITLTGISTDNGLKLYIDGGSVETIAESSTPSGTDNANTSLQLAQEEDTQYFAGKVCEFSAWNRVLSADEITDLYNSGSGLAL